MAVSVAGRVLSKELTETDHRRLLDAAISELPAAPGATAMEGKPDERAPGARPPGSGRAEESPEVARRYAEALIRAAEHEGAVDTVLDELVALDRDVLKPTLGSPQIWPRRGFRRRERPDPGRAAREPGLQPAVAVSCEFSIDTSGSLLGGSLKRPGIWDKRLPGAGAGSSAVPWTKASRRRLARLSKLTGGTPILKFRSTRI